MDIFACFDHIDPLKAENPVFADAANVLNKERKDPHPIEHLSLASNT